MGTRSSIAIKSNNTIRSIYCHWDGYPSGVGITLLEDYADVNKINQLINLGDISILEKNLNPTGSHSFDKREAGVVVAYGRDRGEKNVSAKEHMTIDDWCDACGYADYLYYFDMDKKAWYFKGIGGDFKKLTKAACKDN